MLTFRGVVWFFLIFCASARVWAQSDSQAIALLRPAFEKMGLSKGTRTRFTFLDLYHNLNFNEKGKKTADATQLYDVTYIGELQYSRLLEIDGKALKGRQLTREQRRYDDAVREHSALDDKARAKIMHQVVKSIDGSLSLGELSSKYENAILGHAAVEVCDCVMIESSPLPGGPTRSYKFWVDTGKQEVVRLNGTLLGDEDDKLKGSTFDFQYTYIGGTRLTTHSVIDANLLMSKKRVRVVTEHTYSNFRKFSVTTTILPVESNSRQ